MNAGFMNELLMFCSKFGVYKHYHKTKHCVLIHEPLCSSCERSIYGGPVVGVPYRCSHPAASYPHLLLLSVHAEKQGRQLSRYVTTPLIG